MHLFVFSCTNKIHRNAQYGSQKKTALFCREHKKYPALFCREHKNILLYFAENTKNILLYFAENTKNIRFILQRTLQDTLWNVSVCSCWLQKHTLNVNDKFILTLIFFSSATYLLPSTFISSSVSPYTFHFLWLARTLLT